MKKRKTVTTGWGRVTFTSLFAGFCALMLTSILWAMQALPPTKTGESASFEVASIRPVAPRFSGAEKAVFDDLNNEERQMFLQQFRLRTSAYSGGSCRGIDTKYPPNQSAPAPPLGRCAFTEVPLHDLIVVAYGLEGALEKSVDVRSGWWSNPGETFDVQAKAENPSITEARLRLMLRNLLTDRFKLKFHREPRELQGYALVVDKGGPKFKESKIQDNTQGLPDGQADVMRLRAEEYSMHSLATYLSTYLGRPVLDNTDLAGVYGIALAWQGGGMPAVVRDHASVPDLPTALKEQLGLRLDAQKVAVDFIVIDSAERPTQN